MNKKIIWVIVIAVIVILGVSYGIEKYSQLNTKPVEKRMESTSDWKTYTNTKYGFEFKYPKDWTVDDTSKGAGFATFEYSVYPPCDSSECNDRGSLIQIALLKRNFSEYTGNVNFSNKSIYTLGGKAGFVINSLGQSIYVFEKDGKAFTIVVGITTDTQEKAINKEVNQIFSTFKFTK